MFLRCLGNISVSQQKSWMRWLGRGKSALILLKLLPTQIWIKGKNGLRDINVTFKNSSSFHLILFIYQELTSVILKAVYTVETTILPR